GTNHVLSINTFSRFASRSSIRDIAKIKGFSNIETNQIIKKIQSNDKLDPRLQEILDLSKKFEGLPRQTGTHAAGIILANEDLRYHIPMQQGPLMYQSQFEHEDLNDMGLLKIDFLGIRNLTIIDQVIKQVKKHKNIDIHLDRIPYDCMKTYELLSQGDTLGIFQLESQGMRATLRKLKPRHFNDIVAILALYRPGPMQNIDDYIERRNGKSYQFIDESLAPILKETYGIIIYQEQIMQIAQVFAGYSLIEADLLRVGISKKDHDILQQQEKTFIHHSVLNGKDSKLAKSIYDYILKFADYGFNKSHSVAYSVISYQMAYLKANYYDIFMGVLLSNMTTIDSQTSEMITQMRQRGFDCLAPDINVSTTRFEFSSEGLIYPLTGIKNIGSTIANTIIEERMNGPFTSYRDFKDRLKHLNKRAIEGLIFSGALDNFGLNRKTLYEQMESEVDLYASIVKDLIPITYEEYPIETLIEKEKEVLGFNLIHSFKEEYEDIIKKYKLTHIKDLSFKNSRENTIGIIKQAKVIITKNKEEMAFIELSDNLLSIDVVVFPSTYKKHREVIHSNKVCIVALKKDYQNDKWILENIRLV
ncbi:MAG: DNA polymerase III subunit alpha, partial [Acholeplasmataceae bacterium]